MGWITFWGSLLISIHLRFHEILMKHSCPDETLKLWKYIWMPLQKEFLPNGNLVQQPGEPQQFKVAFTAGNCGWHGFKCNPLSHKFTHRHWNLTWLITWRKNSDTYILSMYVQCVLNPSFEFFRPRVANNMHDKV